MEFINTSIADVILVEPEVYSDERGLFFESFNQSLWERMHPGDDFVQDNHSRSVKHVLRGLHYQIKQAQGKLVRAVVGEIFDVAVDVRRDSQTFGRWTGVMLSAENKRQLWVPKGFAHGFLVLSDVAEVIYKATDYYAPEHERSIIWNDPDLGIDWPLDGRPLLSKKDSSAPAFKDAEVFG